MLGLIQEIIVAQCKSQDKFQCKAYSTLLLCDNEWKGHFPQMWMIGHPSQGLGPYMSKRRGADNHSRNDRWLKALSVCCPFIISYSSTLSFSLYFCFYSILCLTLTFSLDPLTAQSLTLCFFFSVHVRGCEDQWPGSGPLHRMERQFHHRQSRED